MYMDDIKLFANRKKKKKGNTNTSNENIQSG